MNSSLSNRLQNMEASATLTMAVKTRELRNEGKDIIGLSIGEPDFNIPDFIKEAAKQAIDDNYSHYTPVDGYAELKKAIAHKLKRDNALDYSPSQIVVSTGAKQSLFNVAMTVLNPGDEVILPAPYWVSYSEIVKLAEGIPVEVATTPDTGFKLTPKQLKAAITPKTRMLWINSPCNPTGAVYSKAELEGLAEILREHPDIYVVSDEIYEYINFIGDHTSIAELEGMYNRTIIVNGLSKAFAMTGWRLGYIGAPEWIAKGCTKLQGQVTSGANAIAQRAAMAALEAPKSQIQYMIDTFRKRKELVVQLLGEIKGFTLTPPEGAFYIFPDVSAFFGKTLKGVEINNASDFALYLLEHAHVATVTGDAFGNPNYIRISYAASEKELREAIARIKAAVQ